MTKDNISLTIVARIIGSIGIGLSIVLTNVVMFDNKIENFDNTKGVIELFGFDCFYKYDVGKFNEIVGHLPFVVLVILIALKLLTNSLLILGTVLQNRTCSIPYLALTVVLIIWKISSVVINVFGRNKKTTAEFIMSTVVYLVLLSCSWLLIYFAQLSWKQSNSIDVPARINTTMANATMTCSVFDSPGSYRGNSRYAEV